LVAACGPDNVTTQAELIAAVNGADFDALGVAWDTQWGEAFNLGVVSAPWGLTGGWTPASQSVGGVTQPSNVLGIQAWRSQVLVPSGNQFCLDYTNSGVTVMCSETAGCQSALYNLFDFPAPTPITPNTATGVIFHYNDPGADCWNNANDCGSSPP
jgi:hypothetical protein